METKPGVPLADLFALVLRQRFAAAAELALGLLPALEAAPATLSPAEAALVLNALEEGGRFDEALRWVRQTTCLAPVRSTAMARISELRRVFGPVASAVEVAGSVHSLTSPHLAQLGADRLEVPADVGRLDVGLVERGVARMREKLGISWGGVGPIDVELFSDAAAFEARVAAAARIPSQRVRDMLACAVWMGGRDGAHLVAVRAEQAVGLHALEVHQRLRHEYVHLAVRHVSRGRRVPAWLDEGLATALTMNLPDRFETLGSPPRRAELRAWDRELPKDGIELDRALAGSHAAAAALLERHGALWVARGLFDGRPARWWAEAARGAMETASASPAQG